MKTEDEFQAVCVDKLSLSFTCRTCLNTDSDQQLTSIFEEADSSDKLTGDLWKQLTLLNAKIARDDGFPAKVCSLCVERLVTVDAFRKQCAKAQEYLERYFVKVPADVGDIKPDILVCSARSAEHSEKLNESNDIEDIDSQNKDEDKDEDENDVGFESDGSSSEYKPDNEEWSSEDEQPLKPSSRDIDKAKCPICDKMFTTVSSRNNHILLHSGENAFPCDECEMSFKCGRYLKKHKWMVHSVGDYTCPMCDKKFTQTSRYDYHLKTHDKEKRFKCRHCDKSFIQYSHRKSHELTHIEKLKRSSPYLCNICAKSFCHESSLKKHIKSHEAPQKYPCYLCNKVFSQKGNLKLHFAIHNNIRAYQCEQCGKNFIQKGALTAHILLHNAERPHHCKLCSESFLRIRALRRHYLAVHGKTEKSVNFSKSLQENEATAETKEAEKDPRRNNVYPYSCDLCSRTFKVPSSLAKHILIHSEERKFNCTECGNSFKSGRNLENHINSVHLNHKPFSCEVCNKSFARVGDRNVHMQIHSEEKPHKCSFCGKGFNLAKALRAHVRHHTGERPFVCIICNASYTCHKTLASHTRRQHANDPQVQKKVEEIAQAVLYAPSAAIKGNVTSEVETKTETY